MWNGSRGQKDGCERPPIRTITSFEEKNPFEGATVVQEHATDQGAAH
jgi:hypothetical protein